MNRPLWLSFVAVASLCAVLFVALRRFELAMPTLMKGKPLPALSDIVLASRVCLPFLPLPWLIVLGGFSRQRPPSTTTQRLAIAFAVILISLLLSLTILAVALPFVSVSSPMDG